MAKDLRLDVVSSADDKGFAEAALGLERDAKAADKLGDQFRQVTRDGGILAAELEIVKLKSAELARQFDQTGDKALLRQISSTRRYEGQLKNLGKTLEGAAVDAEKAGIVIGEQIGDGISTGIGDASKAAGPEVGPLILAGIGTAALVAAPTVGAMIGGALLAGIGSAGVGGGIALALKDPQVKAAAAGLKKTIGDELKGAATPFIIPTVTAFQQLGAEFKTGVAPELRDVFRELAPEVTVLANGAGKFATEFARGFSKAAIAAKPLLDDLGHAELPALGKATGDFFNTVAEHAPEAQQGLKLLFGAIDGGIHIVDAGIDVLSFFFDAFETGLLLVIDKADDFVTILDDTAKALHLPHGGLDDLKTSLDNTVNGGVKFLGNAKQMPTVLDATSTAADLLNESLTGVYRSTKELNDEWAALDKNLSKDQALVDAKNQVAGIADALDKQSKSLSINTQAGRDNRSALEDRIHSLERDRDALHDDGESAQEAQKKFEGWVRELEKNAEKAGVSKDAIAALNRQLGLLPKKPKNIDINVNINTRDALTKAGHGKIQYFAEGGRYGAGQPMVVGENGPEFMIPDSSGVVIPNKAIASAMPGSAVGGVGGNITVELAAAFGDRTAEVLLSLLRPAVRRRYGGSAQRAIGVT